MDLPISHLLRSAGLRRTRAREVVLGLLADAGRPLSHQEIAAHPGAGGLDRVTLYRTLASLRQGRLLHRVQGTDRTWRYGLHGAGGDGCPGDHVHFLCLECGAMTCLDGQPLPFVEVPAGARVTGKQLVVHGLCAGCAAGG